MRKWAVSCIVTYRTEYYIKLRFISFIRWLNKILNWDTFIFSNNHRINGFLIYFYIFLTTTVAAHTLNHTSSLQTAIQFICEDGLPNLLHQNLMILLTVRWHIIVLLLLNCCIKDKLQVGCSALKTFIILLLIAQIILHSYFFVCYRFVMAF